jgi:hypothetical protein
MNKEVSKKRTRAPPQWFNEYDMDYKEKTQGKRTEKVQKKYIVKQFEDKM